MPLLNLQSKNGQKVIVLWMCPAQWLGLLQLKEVAVERLVNVWADKMGTCFVSKQVNFCSCDM